jgi:4-hydroxyphenylpyruvate dioxygenase-like putative hemolysin
MAPEIFISDGTTDSIVKKWVDDKNGIGGIHHIAYQVDSVAVMMDMMVDKGYVEFTTDKPLTCPGLTQIFTKPSVLTGVIYEFIERTEQGFCKENVKDLMNSTKNI